MLLNIFIIIINLNIKLQNAEISTPYKLRKEMLDKIPKDFWTKKNKVFKPCAGN
jgi:hypothetical protein